MRLIDGDALIERFNEKASMSECLIDERTAERFAMFCKLADAVEDAPTIEAETISDGYHTFADLYEQRLILSAALAKGNPNAWKSKLHEDGTKPFGGGWFIVGFDTAEGCYTYHYELKDYDLFECKELPTGKHWDGHTSKDVRRLLSMPTIETEPVRHGHWILEREPNGKPYCFHCSVCDADFHHIGIKSATEYCSNCGAKMDEKTKEDPGE